MRNYIQIKDKTRAIEQNLKAQLCCLEITPDGLGYLSHLSYFFNASKHNFKNVYHALYIDLESLAFSRKGLY